MALDGNLIDAPGGQLGQEVFKRTEKPYDSLLNFIIPLVFSVINKKYKDFVGEYGFSSSDVEPGSVDQEIFNYLDGIFSSLGQENSLQRDFNSAEAIANREFQAAEAQKQRQWYTDLSSSAYQRSVTDMRAAGLNPILAVSGGFAPAASSATSVPSGSAATSTASGGDTLSSLLESVAALISSVGSSARGVGSILHAVKKKK